jgi:hypothetical protein
MQKNPINHFAEIFNFIKNKFYFRQSLQKDALLVTYVSSIPSASSLVDLCRGNLTGESAPSSDSFLISSINDDIYQSKTVRKATQSVLLEIAKPCAAGSHPIYLGSIFNTSQHCLFVFDNTRTRNKWFISKHTNRRFAKIHRITTADCIFRKISSTTTRMKFAKDASSAFTHTRSRPIIKTSTQQRRSRQQTEQHFQL